jgi:hypothetical protein
MRGRTQKDCMTKCLLMICVCLGCLVLLAGCTGTQSAPQAPPQVIQPVEPPQQLNTAPEPNEVRPKEQSRGVEPNETITSDVPEVGPTQAMQTGGSVKAEGLDGGERADHRQAALDDANRPAEDQGTRDVVSESATAGAEKATMGKQETVERNETTASGEPNVVKPEAIGTPHSAFRTPQLTPSFIDAYAELLQGNAQADGSVDYGNLHRRRLEVKQILMELGELDPNTYAAWSSDEKLAFWINAYNLKMLQVHCDGRGVHAGRGGAAVLPQDLQRAASLLGHQLRLLVRSAPAPPAVPGRWSRSAAR